MDAWFTPMWAAMHTVFDTAVSFAPPSGDAVAAYGIVTHDGATADIVDDSGRYVEETLTVRIDRAAWPGATLPDSRWTLTHAGEVWPVQRTEALAGQALRIVCVRRLRIEVARQDFRAR